MFLEQNLGFTSNEPARSIVVSFCVRCRFPHVFRRENWVCLGDETAAFRYPMPKEIRLFVVFIVSSSHVSTFVCVTILSERADTRYTSGH